MVWSAAERSRSAHNVTLSAGFRFAKAEVEGRGGMQSRDEDGTAGKSAFMGP
jgi:hypothetical protein